MKRWRRFIKRSAIKITVSLGFSRVERERVYRQDKIYTIQIRTIDENLMNYFKEHLINAYTEEMKSLTMTVRRIKKIPIGRIYTLTPVIQKSGGETVLERDCHT